MLRYGAFNALLVRTLATLATLSLAFVVVSLAAAFLDAVLPGGAEPIALGVVVVVLLLVAEWIAPAIRDRARSAFRTSRQRSRQRLDRLGEEIRTIVDVETLAQRPSTVTGQALQRGPPSSFSAPATPSGPRQRIAPKRPRLPRSTWAACGTASETRDWSGRETRS